MKDYEKALEKFIQPWIKKKEVIGILLCGSYVTGNPTKNSDLDVQIILDDKVTWRERGNKIIDGFLIEYFANPVKMNYIYFDEDFEGNRLIQANMISTGKVIYSKDNQTISKLKKDAKKYLNKAFKKPNKTFIEIKKYHLWDLLDNLDEAYNNKEINFDFIYYNFLNEMKDIYFKAKQYHFIQAHKTERLIFDKKNQKKYLVRELEDKKFKSLFKKCLEVKSKKDKIEAFKNLNRHILKELGGFNIDGWKIKTKAE